MALILRHETTGLELCRGNDDKLGMIERVWPTVYPRDTGFMPCYLSPIPSRIISAAKLSRQKGLFMRSRRFLASLLLTFFVGAFTTRGADAVLITEFMAVNNGPLTDENGQFSDWIEIHNAGTNNVNLDGWYLTDRPSDLKQWRFPATNLPPNGYLVVFASGDDRRVPGAALHTNFRLASDGEFLALVKPDGVTVASAFAPAYPGQVGTASFGLPLEQTESLLIGAGAEARVLVPTDGGLGSAWTGLLFDDSAWDLLPTGIGYETDGVVPFVPAQLANSVSEFSGVQGLNNWQYGYWNASADSNGEYAASEFTPFPNSGGAFGANNFWNGSSWDWFNGNPPYTQLTSQGGLPSGDNGVPGLPVHWAIRRYINEHDGPITISGRITHTSDWVYVTASGISASSLLYVYLTDVGEGYLDDVKLVAGLVPEVGANLIANGDFETPQLSPSWAVAPNMSGSSITTAVRKSGSRSLRLVASAGGSTLSSSISQTLNPALPSGQIYTLSYWYLPVVTNLAPLTIRFSGSWIDSTPAYCGDGVVARIFVDGEPVFAQPALVQSESYSITVPATLGSRVDFAIDPGQAGDDNCDGATFTANIQSSDPNISVVADSVRDWSLTGRQGENNWYYGYWNAGSNVPPRAYTASDFRAFPRDGGPFGPGNYWTGREWDWWNGDPPVDEIGERLMWANGLNNTNVHSVIRRWISEVSGTVIVDWTVTKLEAQGGGVTCRVFQNGIQRDFITLPGTNAPIVRRSVVLSGVSMGDPIDIVLDPAGTGSTFGDGGDRCFVTATIRGSASLGSQVAGDVQGMQGLASSLYLRLPFTVTDPSQIEFLTLRMKYDDGFAAWINGVPVASANAPFDLQWNATATATRSDADANQFVEFNVTAARGALQIGNNVLAIQALNRSALDSDLLALPELLAVRTTLATNVGRYFAVQTPGAANGFGQSTLGPIVSEAAHQPTVPNDDQNLLVTARVLPTFRAVGNVRLQYRVMYGAESQVTMFDDGVHGDGAAGDGVYGATIPASASNPGQMVRYYVVATDVQGNSGRYPAFDDPQNSPQYQGTVIANPALTNSLPVLHMFVQNPVLTTNTTGTRCSLFYDDEFYDNVAVNLHGQTTAAVFAKRSMDIDLNRGQSFRWKRGEDRVNDFVLLTTAADKAYVRQAMAYETFSNAGVPTHFAFPVRLQQNGQFFGVFHFVEKGDDNFLSRVGLDPQGALYKVYLPLTNAYGGVAEKKTRQGEPNDDLAALVAGISQSGQALRQYVFDNIDIPELVNYLATIQLVQNEDCCFYKNYYLYRDTRGNGEWQMLPWDLDLTFGRTFEAWYQVGNELLGGYYSTNIYWTNAYYSQARAINDFIGVSQPIADAVFSIPETAEMFYRRWTSVNLEFLRTNNTHPLLLGLERRADELAGQIRADAALDLAKWSTYAPVQTMDVAVQVLKTEYFARRRGWVFNTLAFANGGPYVGPQPTNAAIRISAVDYNPAGGQAQEYVQITNANTYAVDVSGWKVSGGIEHTFKPGTVIPARNVLYLSPDVNAFRARASGPRGGLGLFVQGNYRGQLSTWGESVVISDLTGRTVNTTNLPVVPSAVQRYLRITEIMYNPSPVSGNTTDPQEFEYIELRNTGPVTLNLGGVALTAGVEFRFPAVGLGSSLAAGESVLVVRNPAAFAARYGAGFAIAGQFTGSLDNAGETLRLEDATGEKVLEFSYDNTWYPITDGFGFSLVVANESTSWENWGLPSNWRANGQLNGSPGQPNPLPPVIAAVRINEVLSASTPPAVDSVELFNPTAAPANVGGWFLSDDFRTPRKYRLPNNTIIPAGGHLVLTEAQFNVTNPPSATAFAFSSDGDEVYLFSADLAGNLTGYEHGFAFGTAEPGVTFGRHVISTGAEHLVAQAAATLGGANAGPRVGPIVISEVHYHPVTLTGEEDNAEDEFVEIRNITGASVPLYDPANPANRWQIAGGVQYVFPPGTAVVPGELVLIVNFDPTNASRLEAFRQRVPVTIGTRILGPLQGKLDNSSDTVALIRPGTPGVSGVPYILVDQIDYTDEAPWPSLVDGTGASLQRRLASSYGNDPINWVSARPTAGQIFLNGVAPAITVQPANVVTGATMTARFSVVASGSDPLSYQWSFEGETIPGATGSTLFVPNVQFDQQGNYSVVVYNSAGAVASSNATLRLLLPPYFSRPPTNALVRIRPDPQAAPTTNASFSVQARGLGALSYQWYFKGQPIPGATATNLTISNVQLANGGEYSVAVTDSIGTVFSPPANLYPLISPTIVQQPIGQTVVVGGTVTLSVAVTGSPAPFSFEWRRGTLAVANLSSDSPSSFFTFTAPAVLTNNAYRVIVRNLANPVGGVASALANVSTTSDSDGDGLTDAWEIQYGLDPASAADGLIDTDGDGVRNVDEYVAGTDPNDPASFLRVEASATDIGAVAINFGAIAGHTYTIQYREDFENAAWKRLTDVPARAFDGVERVSDPAFGAGRYYRVVTPRQP